MQLEITVAEVASCGFGNNVLLLVVADFLAHKMAHTSKEYESRVGNEEMDTSTGGLDFFDPAYTAIYTDNPSLLHEACFSGMEREVVELIENLHVSPYKTDHFGRSTLLCAIHGGQARLVDYLITKFPGIRTCTDPTNGFSAIKTACKLNRIEILKSLCKQVPNEISKEIRDMIDSHVQSQCKMLLNYGNVHSIQLTKEMITILTETNARIDGSVVSKDFVWRPVPPNVIDSSFFCSIFCKYDLSWRYGVGSLWNLGKMQFVISAAHLFDGVDVENSFFVYKKNIYCSILKVKYLATSHFLLGA